MAECCIADLAAFLPFDFVMVLGDYHKVGDEAPGPTGERDYKVVALFLVHGGHDLVDVAFN